MARKPTTTTADLTAGIEEDATNSPAGGLLGELEGLLPTQTPSEPTIALTGLSVASSEPTLPGFEMADDPLPPPTTQTMAIMEAQDPERQPAAQQASSGPLGAPVGYSGLINAMAAGTAPTPGGDGTFTGARNAMAQAANTPRDIPLQGDILTGDHVTYESRIRVLDAWQYPGSIPKTAPAYVDRNWAAWAEWDPVRRIEPGPSLRVPVAGDVTVMCRVGDYVVRQEIQMGDGMPSEVKVEVWSRQDFERIFIHVAMKTVEEVA